MEPHSFLATSAFLLFLQVTISTSQVIDRSLCKDHPAFDNSLNPVLIRSWANGGSLPKVEQVAYLPRYIGHGYTPIEDPSSKKYIALDLFHTANAMRAPNIRVNFQRAALVYMFVNVDSTEFNKTLVATLPGWQSEGWAKRSFGGNNILYGVYEKLSRKMSTYVYVFSKTTTQDNFVEIPQSLFVKVRIEGISATGSFNLWIAESDGSGSKPVGKFNGKDVEPNKKCPNELHDAWRVKFENPADPSTKGVLFRTWHPQWDPCFWCTYGHEHGSSPKDLMGYVPKFDLLEAKGGPPSEPDAGFKGYVLRNGDFLIYLSLHSLTSSTRRVLKRFYTVNLVVVDRLDRKVLVDMQYRADLGFAAVKLLDGSLRPISKRDAAIRERQESDKEPTKFRSINVLDIDDPDPDYEYRSPILAGVFEELQTSLLCSESANLNNTFSVILKEPSTAIKSQVDKATLVDLGRFLGGTDDARMFYQNPGLYRSLRFADLKFTDKICPEGVSGEFYTDIDGNVVDGPAPTSVRQYFEADFSFTINGRFEVTDPWFGLHNSGVRGFYFNHGYGIDPNEN